MYLPTVSRWIPNSTAIRRHDQPRSYNVRIECTCATRSWFAIAGLQLKSSATYATNLSLMVAGFQSAREWLVFRFSRRFGDDPQLLVGCPMARPYGAGGFTKMAREPVFSAP